MHSFLAPSDLNSPTRFHEDPKIKFDFVPHVDTDISWFGTGYNYVGFRIIANHRRILGGAVETFDGKCEECLLASRPEAYSRAATNGPASRLISQSRSRKLRLFANARNAAP